MIFFLHTGRPFLYKKKNPETPSLPFSAISFSFPLSHISISQPRGRRHSPLNNNPYFCFISFNRLAAHHKAVPTVHRSQIGLPSSFCSSPHTTALTNPVPFPIELADRTTPTYLTTTTKTPVRSQPCLCPP